MTIIREVWKKRHAVPTTKLLMIRAEQLIMMSSKSNVSVVYYKNNDLTIIKLFL